MEDEDVSSHNSGSARSLSSARNGGAGPKLPSKFVQFKPIDDLDKQVTPRRNGGPQMLYKMHRTNVKLVKAVLDQNGFKSVASDDYHILWTGGHIKPAVYSHLAEYQKVNHFPRTFEVTRKDKMYENIDRMKQIHGARHFDFIPTTFVLPLEQERFFSEFMRSEGPSRNKPSFSNFQAQMREASLRKAYGGPPSTAKARVLGTRKGGGAGNASRGGGARRNDGYDDAADYDDDDYQDDDDGRDPYDSDNEDVGDPTADAMDEIDPQSYLQQQGKSSSSIPGGGNSNQPKSAKEEMYDEMSKIWKENYDSTRGQYASSGPPANFWIVKPAALSRGRGIRLVGSLDEIAMEDDCVISRYVTNPFLIDGFKFDLRLYVAVTSFDPLVIYFYDEGLVRFCTERFSTDPRFLHRRFMHLTNYSVNKMNRNYVNNVDAEMDCVGNKWSLSAFRRYLQSIGVDDLFLFARIEDLIVKTLLSIESQVNVAMSMYVPGRHNCFELFGFDVLIDEDLRPWLLEVNLSPSLSCESPLDTKIKSNLISDLFNLAGFKASDAKNSDPSMSSSRLAATYGSPIRPGAGSSNDYNRRSGAFGGVTIGSGNAMNSGRMSSRSSSDYMSIGNSKNSLNGRYEIEQRVMTRVFGLDKYGADERRIIREFLEEQSRRGKFSLVFPGPRTKLYDSFFETRRRYNVLMQEFIASHPNYEELLQIAQADIQNEMVALSQLSNRLMTGAHALMSSGPAGPSGYASYPSSNSFSPPNRRNLQSSSGYPMDDGSAPHLLSPSRAAAALSGSSNSALHSIDYNPFSAKNLQQQQPDDGSGDNFNFSSSVSSSAIPNGGSSDLYSQMIQARRRIAETSAASSASQNGKRAVLEAARSAEASAFLMQQQQDHMSANLGMAPGKSKNWAAPPPTKNNGPRSSSVPAARPSNSNLSSSSKAFSGVNSKPSGAFRGGKPVQGKPPPSLPPQINNYVSPTRSAVPQPLRQSLIRSHADGRPIPMDRYAPPASKHMDDEYNLDDDYDDNAGGGSFFLTALDDGSRGNNRSSSSGPALSRPQTRPSNVPPLSLSSSSSSNSKPKPGSMANTQPVRPSVAPSRNPQQQPWRSGPVGPTKRPSGPPPATAPPAMKQPQQRSISNPAPSRVSRPGAPPAASVASRLSGPNASRQSFGAANSSNNSNNNNRRLPTAPPAVQNNRSGNSQFGAVSVGINRSATNLAPTRQPSNAARSVSNPRPATIANSSSQLQRAVPNTGMANRNRPSGINVPSPSNARGPPAAARGFGANASPAAAAISRSSVGGPMLIRNAPQQQIGRSKFASDMMLDDFEAQFDRPAMVSSSNFSNNSNSRPLQQQQSSGFGSSSYSSPASKPAARPSSGSYNRGSSSSSQYRPSGGFDGGFSLRSEGISSQQQRPPSGSYSRRLNEASSSSFVGPYQPPRGRSPSPVRALSPSLSSEAMREARRSTSNDLEVLNMALAAADVQKKLYNEQQRILTQKFQSQKEELSAQIMETYSKIEMLKHGMR